MDWGKRFYTAKRENHSRTKISLLSNETIASNLKPDHSRFTIYASGIDHLFNLRHSTRIELAFSREVHHPNVIAIDGPRASGKSTNAQMVAQAWDYVYVDTGAMYRALAWSCLQKR